MPADSLDRLVSLCKRRGFVFPGGDIYGGLQGTYDYGPLGVELKRNLKDAWWRSVVSERDDMEGLDSSILTHRLALRYSGHEATFCDPLIDNKKTQKRYRLDHLVKEQSVEVRTSLAGAIGVADAGDVTGMVKALLDDPARAATAMTGARVCDPSDGKPGEWTRPRMFNMMFRTNVGPVEQEDSFAYLRPETAQGIFVNFRNVVDATSRTLPFGIAQIGKAFRNEITPKNFVFRVREFEQMEIEYFVPPGQDEEWHARWVEWRLAWWKSQGLSSDRLECYHVPAAELSHYSKATVDIMYRFPHGLEELEGVANRTDFDLGSHTKGQEGFGLTAAVTPNRDSTVKLAVQDTTTGKWVVPFVIEPSAGVDRGVLAVLTEAYTEEVTPDGSDRVVLRLKPHLSPIKVAVIPLAKNKPEIVGYARSLLADLRGAGLGRVTYEDTGNIGKAYRRHDEIGTPFSVTIDYDTLGRGPDDSSRDTVTVRDRDTTRQERIPSTRIADYVRDRLRHQSPP